MIDFMSPLVHSYLHHSDSGVNLGRQRNVDLILVSVNAGSTEKTLNQHKFNRYLKPVNLLISSIFEKIILPYPTLMPSSMSVGATWSLRSTTNLANCLTLMIYFGSSESALMIFVHLLKGKKFH